MKLLFRRLLPLTGSVMAAFVATLAIGSILLLLGGHEALAQAAAAVSTKVDLSPLLSEVVWPLLGTLATAFAGWVATKAATWFHLSSQDTVRGYVMSALQNGLAAAQAKMAGKPIAFDTHDQTVAFVANHLITTVPQGLKMLGFSLQPDDPKLLALIQAQTAAATPTPAGQ